ncbi:hypothetical protein J3R83DRAFT_7518 [Lanmaoa asiatica]|nr:hypothetical protein J3R83DRAFT_7475 [Lanmaoa asiatica]KAH0826032.1 hypothetical protein J3R83DRAFT_7518 [Lanmaoa asiatica]
MHNELERSEEIADGLKRRQDLTSQLSQKHESVGYITLQKDMDVKDLRLHLDKVVRQPRESLACQIQGNAEKLAVYERRTTGANAAAVTPDPDLPREQQLKQEVTDLWCILSRYTCRYGFMEDILSGAQLKVVQVDLAAARGHMQQLQGISQANEAALAVLNNMQDEYKADAEAQLARHEVVKLPYPVKARVRLIRLAYLTGIISLYTTHFLMSKSTVSPHTFSASQPLIHAHTRSGHCRLFARIHHPLEVPILKKIFTATLKSAKSINPNSAFPETAFSELAGKTLVNALPTLLIKETNDAAMTLLMHASDAYRPSARVQCGRTHQRDREGA